MAYDGSIKIDTSIDGNGFKKGLNQLNQSAEKGLGGFIKGLGVFEIIKSGVNMVLNQTAAAMKRIDTMAQFSTVMKTMTGSVTTANKALSSTTKIVTGTAYGLDVAAKAVQSFVSRGMGVNTATRTIENFANAVSFYGDGTSASLESVSNALGKMQTKGNVTMEHLDMLFEAGIPAVEIYAQATGQASSDVTDAMSKGLLSTDDFVDGMNRAFETGTTGFPSVAGAAKNAGASWSGTFDNMKAALTRGVQSIINSFEDTTKAAKMPGAKDAVKTFGKIMETTMKGIAKVVEVGVLIFAKFGDIIGIVAGGILAYKVAMATASTVTAAVTKVKATYTTATTLASAAVEKLMLDEGILTVKEAALAAIKLVLAGNIGIVTAAQLVWNAAMAANPIGTVIVALTALIAVIALVVKGVKSIIGWKNKESAAYKENKSELEDLADAQEDYDKQLADTTKSHKEAVAAVDAQEASAKDLLGTITKLSKKENKSEDDKRRLAVYVDRLNESQEGLNVTYDEATDTLSSTTDEIYNMIESNAKLAKQEAMANYAKELTTNLTEVETKLKALTNAQINYKKQLDDETISRPEYNKLMKESQGLIEEYAAKKEEVSSELAAATELQLEAEREAAAERERIAEQEKANLQAVADKWGVSVETIQQEMADEEQSLGEWEAAHGAAVQEIADKWDVSTEQIQSAMRNTGISIEEYDKKFEEMVDRQKETFKDYTAAATNVFSQIKDESETTIDDMIENLNHNANAMSQWSDNIAILAKRGIRDGLLQQMVDAGPQAASALQSLVNASDEKLNELNLAFDEAGNSTVKAYNKWYEVDPQNAASLRMLYGEAEAVKSNTSVPDALKENAEKGVKSAQKGMNKESGKKTAENFTDGVASEITHDKSVDTAMRGIGKSAEKAFESAISTLPQKANSAMTQVAATIKSGMQTAANTTKSSVNGITSVFDSMKSRVTASASQLGSQVSSALKTGMNSASGSVKSIVNNIVNDFNSAKSRVTASVRSMMSGAQTAVNSGGANLRKSASSAANNIVSGFRSAQYQMSNIGYNMMSGVNSAMWGMSSTLYSTARTIANGVAATMRRALQIHSPSRIMQKIFQFFMAGGVVGMHDKEKDLYGTAEGIANKVSASIVPDVDLSGMLAKARAAISAEQSRMSANFAANAEYKTTVIAAQQEVQESTPMVETHINIDSREFAVATTPAIMKQAGWSPA